MKGGERVDEGVRNTDVGGLMGKSCENDLRFEGGEGWGKVRI